MKNLSLILNAVLVIAVAFLFYKTYSNPSAETASAVAADSTAGETPVIVPLSAATAATLPKGVLFNFVNADTIFKYYDYAKRSKAAGEGKVAQFQRTVQEKYAALQQEYNDYVEKAGKGQYTKEQGEAIEAGLQRKQQELMQMQQNEDKILGELDNSSVEVNKRIYEYLKRFNHDHGYYCTLAFTLTGGGVLGISDSLDVTRQVIEGLNAEYKASKGK